MMNLDFIIPWDSFEFSEFKKFNNIFIAISKLIKYSEKNTEKFKDNMDT